MKGWAKPDARGSDACCAFRRPGGTSFQSTTRLARGHVSCPRVVDVIERIKNRTRTQGRS